MSNAELPTDPGAPFPRERTEVGERLRAYSEFLPFERNAIEVVGVGRGVAAYLDHIPETRHLFRMRDLVGSVDEYTTRDTDTYSLAGTIPTRLLAAHRAQCVNVAESFCRYRNPAYIHYETSHPEVEDVGMWLELYASVGYIDRTEAERLAGVDRADDHLDEPYTELRARGRKWMANTFVTTMSWTDSTHAELAHAFGCAASTVARYIDVYADFAVAPPDPSTDGRFDRGMRGSTPASERPPIWPEPGSYEPMEQPRKNGTFVSFDYPGGVADE